MESRDRTNRRDNGRRIDDFAGRGSDPAGRYQDTAVISGLVNPTRVVFASDDRVFVAEKSGLLKVFEGVNDTTPSILVHLRSNVHNHWDRRLLGMVLARNFPTVPISSTGTWSIVNGSGSQGRFTFTASTWTIQCAVGTLADGPVVTAQIVANQQEEHHRRYRDGDQHQVPGPDRQRHDHVEYPLM
jgi:hypothetical protein